MRQRGATIYLLQIKETKVTRLCHEKTILAVNGHFPGPTIYARKGDVVVVNVYNQGNKNITIHWHGVDQPRNPWSDGPEYITQCPIQPGANFTYTIIFSEEEGTLWWHAHSDFDRATVHGAIVIHPKHGSTYPYPKPHKEIPIILGEWWNVHVEQVLEESKLTGGDGNISDVNTINGQPGDKFPCSKNGTFRLPVEHGKTYLLQVINAGLSSDMFFGVAGHRLTVVGTDGVHGEAPEHPVDVPMHVDERMLVTIAINVLPCGPTKTCEGPKGNRFSASLNNASFSVPSVVDVLDAYYYSIHGVYEPDFPNEPPFLFNFTQGLPLELAFTKRSATVKVVEHGTVVEVVFQNTAILGFGSESHPMHLHGFSFYVVGRGFGNFDENKDPDTYNLVDPPKQNTVSVPKDGWAAIRFRAANPGENLQLPLWLQYFR
nr:unnamed protein product [Digitaria exilis]